MSLIFDPNAVFFTIPYFNHPISWYGCIFALSFFCGFKIFIWMYKRILIDNITIEKQFLNTKVEKNHQYSKKSKALQRFYSKYNTNSEKKDKLALYLYLEEKFPKEITSISKKAESYADKALLYIIIGTIVGARLGHILFYENILDFILSPLSILKTWEGGLASHGGIIAIIIASYLFVKKNKELSYICFLDLLSIPTMFVCAWIRIGNFMNQEILGRATNCFWGITFLHPADFGPVVPRHPMQIYEFLLYIATFFLVFFLWKKNPYKSREGLYIGLTLSVAFSVRLFLEFLKVNQSVYDHLFFLQMGQLLNIPMIALGFFLIFKKRNSTKKKHTSNIN